MQTLANNPSLIFAVSLSILSLAAWIGSSVRSRWQDIAEEAREDLSVVQAATLTLLALVIGFTFSMAVVRYDLRKTYEEAAANAIGTEYVRAGLLPVADTVRVQALLLKYLDERILFYNAGDARQLAQINTRTAQLQSELWAAIQTPALAQPTPLAALVAAGMNDVLNSQSYVQAAWWNRIPHAAWLLMAAIAVCGNLLVGFGVRSAKGKYVILFLPIVISLAFLLIADIDSPRGGLIRVTSQNLISLSQSLHAQ